MMKLMFLMLAMFALVVGKVSAAEDEANDHLNSSTDDEGLIFYATFDKGVDADNAAGDANGFPSGPEAKRFAPGIQNQGLRIGKDIDADENFSLRFKGGKNISSERGTISFWIKPENWKGNNKAANMFVSAVKNKGLFYIYKYRDNNLLFYTDENKEVVRSRYNASAWQPLQWYHVAVTYDPIEMANNLRQSNGVIPGIRPGKPTSDYFGRILSKVTLLGALFLAFISLLPIGFSAFTGMGNLSMGGTSIIIMVGVALETVKQMESQLMMKHYKGFLD